MISGPHSISISKAPLHASISSNVSPSQIFDEKTKIQANTVEPGYASEHFLIVGQVGGWRHCC
jgi:hypothetical protein